MTYRWLTEDEIETLVNPALHQRGEAMLNIGLARVMGAFDGPWLVEFLVLQLFPVLGPMIRVDNTKRDNGEVSRRLADDMDQYLEDSNARGYLAVCDSPVTERICQRHGMKKLESPVYIAVAP